jgi:hypothetical protein
MQNDKEEYILHIHDLDVDGQKRTLLVEMSKWTPFIVLQGCVNPISTLLMNITLISVDLQTRDLRSAIADRHTSKKRQMRISK